MDNTLEYLRRELAGFQPELGLVLGSGLGSFADECVEVERKIPYAEIPHFPKSTVAGHAGNLILGNCRGKQVLCFQGRFHYYEGYSMQQLVLPVRVSSGLGIKRLILTNAAGGIAAGMTPGDLMLIEDHINFMGVNPLRNPSPSPENNCGERFPDMTEIYTSSLRVIAGKAAQELGIALKSGVYLACSGPSFETPAEIRAFRKWGASAVGMSTVPEAMAARQMGLEVLGISCITNLGAGLSGETLSHGEVEETAARVREKFGNLLEGIIAGIS